jgi:hypothetical protein
VKIQLLLQIPTGNFSFVVYPNVGPNMCDTLLASLLHSFMARVCLAR